MDLPIEASKIKLATVMIVAVAAVMVISWLFGPASL